MSPCLRVVVARQERRGPAAKEASALFLQGRPPLPSLWGALKYVIGNGWDDGSASHCSLTSPGTKRNDRAMAGFLKVEQTKIVDGEGKEVILRGAGLGGWMT